MYVGLYFGPRALYVAVFGLVLRIGPAGPARRTEWEPFEGVRVRATLMDDGRVRIEALRARHCGPGGVAEDDYGMLKLRQADEG